MISLADVIDGGVELGDVDVGVLLLQFLDGLAGAISDLDSTAAPRAQHLKADDRLAVEQRQLAQFGGTVFDVGNRVHAHFAPVCQHDLQRLQFLHALDDAGGAQCLFAATDARFAAGQFNLRALQLAGHIGRRNAQRGHAIGVEVDAHFAGHAAGAVDLAHALDGGDFARDDQIDEPRQLGVGHVVGADAIADDRKAGGAGARDLRLVRIGRQVGADA